MKPIFITAVSVLLGFSLVSTVFAQVYYSPSYNSSYYTTVCTQDVYVCPNGTTVGRTGSNCQFICPSTSYNNSYNNNYTNLNSYSYTSGCYTYYYNGYTRSTSVTSYNCSNNYNNNNSYSNYTYTVPSTYYYTTPSTNTYYTNTSPYYTYQYQNGSWYPGSSYNSSYNNYNIGYTNTGYNYGYSNYNYGNTYGDGFVYTQPNPCYYQNGYQVCY